LQKGKTTTHIGSLYGGGKTQSQGGQENDHQLINKLLGGKRHHLKGPAHLGNFWS
jgi:hypothetical protein